jgi:TolB-like protein/class 3 adenylate cyclase/Tfp pilus assembly protein PilF
LERKLTAILCADVFGYSRLMGEDEEATLRTLSSHRKLIDSLIEQHRGRFVNSAGDSVLAEFASVVNAVQCAVEIQIMLKAKNADLPPERRMEFRIGVNLGDVMVDGEQIYGDGVNVAARLEGLAEPGGICISGTVHEQVRDKLALSYDDAGEQEVKNIVRPVRVWRVLTEAATGGRLSTRTPRVPRNYVRRGVFAIAGLTIIAATIVFVQHLSLRPPITTASIPQAQSPALTLPDKPSIAVLPFTNMSGDSQQEYFSDGMTDDIISALSRLPGLFVIDRDSAFTYKGKPVKAQQVSRELGVHYVLEGSVRKAGNQVRITAELVDAVTGADLWAERYDRPVRDIFSLQDEIVRRIVTTLNLELSVLRRPPLTGTDLSQSGIAWSSLGGRTDNLEAYDDYLRGVKYSASFIKDRRGVKYSASLVKESYLKAQQMFEKAIELDPKYAAAYVSLGYIYRFEWVWQWNPDPNILDKAFHLAQQAIALDDSLASAHGLLGVIYILKRQFDKGISQAERAVSLDPNSADAYNTLAWALDNADRPADAIAAAEKAMRLDPRRQDQYLIWKGLAYTQMGHYEEAIPVVKQFQASYPNVLGSHFCHLYLIVDYVELGRDGDARSEAADFLRFSPNLSLDEIQQRTPLKDQATLDRFSADFRKAGLK